MHPSTMATVSTTSPSSSSSQSISSSSSSSHVLPLSPAVLSLPEFFPLQTPILLPPSTASWVSGSSWVVCGCPANYSAGSSLALATHSGEILLFPLTAAASSLNNS